MAIIDHLILNVNDIDASVAFYAVRGQKRRPLATSQSAEGAQDSSQG